jgi:hypothetical protein
VARSLAGPMPRSRVLKLAVAGAVSVLLPAMRSSSAQAACPTCSSGVACDLPNGVGCIHLCCAATDTCCKFPAQGGHIASVVCCSPGALYSCNQAASACQCKKPCGSGCCFPEETCADASTGKCCVVPCGKSCCGHGEKCVDPSSGTCCAAGEHACFGPGHAICCTPGFSCCTGSEGTSCCGPGASCKDGICQCSSGEIPCGDSCCKTGETCCETPNGGVCAKPGWSCCGDTPCQPGAVCCVDRTCYDPTRWKCCGFTMGFGGLGTGYGVCPINSECCPDGCCPAGSSCTAHGCLQTATGRITPKMPFVNPNPGGHGHQWASAISEQS